MELVLAAVAIILVSGIASLLLHRSPGAASNVGAAGIVLGSLAGLVPVITTIIHGITQSIAWTWSVPGGNFAVGLDPLSAIFLLVIFGMSVPVSVYGRSYLWHDRSEHNSGITWFFTCVLVASMVTVVVARNAVLFLMAWEAMAISSFFLVVGNGKKSGAQRAGWTYLVASHIGTAFLLAFFILLGRNGSFDFEHFTPGTHAGLLFILGLIGFGAKAGFVPLHVWLPEAHPEAPSHISALMSGVMIKIGIYGILRSLTFLGPPSEWWGWLLLGIGLTSGVLGVLFALAQHDLKRLLAYHSVENIGIIAIGLGIGLLGISLNLPGIAVLGFGGGLLHVVNHALFKGLLFLGAGAVVQSTRTREIDSLGGILKRMRWTGLTFLIGSVAICGLPPLNGFISELLIYLGALHGGVSIEGKMAVAGIITLGALALIGGLAVACFTKAFGIVFLGEARSEHASGAHEVNKTMLIPMLALGVACLAIGLLAPFIIRPLTPVITQISQLPANVVSTHLMAGTVPLRLASIGSGIILGLAILLASWRLWLLRGRKVTAAVTWDCGYVNPTPRMQYTAASFARPITRMFRGILGTRQHLHVPDGPFPRSAELETHTPDVFYELLFRPIFRGIDGGLAAFRWLQHGNVHLYVLYILVTLLILMFWKLR